MDKRKRVLNAGCGAASSSSFHRGFMTAEWDVVRFDINPKVEPDVVGSVSDMRALFEDRTFDAIWSSHNIEHLRAHEVIPSLLEFRRILKPTGFLLVTCPDLEAVTSLLLSKGLHFVAYDSPAGPITVHDMIFGHSASIASGDDFMSHNTGFTQDSLGKAAMRAGFSQAQVGRDTSFNLWGLLLMAEADMEGIRRCLGGSSAEFLLTLGTSSAG